MCLHNMRSFFPELTVFSIQLLLDLLLEDLRVTIGVKVLRWVSRGAFVVGRPMLECIEVSCLGEIARLKGWVLFY